MLMNVVAATRRHPPSTSRRAWGEWKGGSKPAKAEREKGRFDRDDLQQISEANHRRQAERGRISRLGWTERRLRFNKSEAVDERDKERTSVIPDH